MKELLLIVGGWIVVSVPVSLVMGRVLKRTSRRDDSVESQTGAVPVHDSQRDPRVA